MTKQNFGLVGSTKETLIYSPPFGLSLSKPLIFRELPFDRPVLSRVEGLRANGIVQRFPKEQLVERFLARRDCQPEAAPEIAQQGSGANA